MLYNNEKCVQLCHNSYGRDTYENEQNGQSPCAEAAGNDAPPGSATAAGESAAAAAAGDQS